MKSMVLAAFAALWSAWLIGSPTAQGAGILSSSDIAIAIDAHGKTARSSYPGQGNPNPGEGPAKAIDGMTSTKYLNFGHSGSGIIVTPSAVTPVESFQLTTGNDQPSRDPASWELWGYNGTITSADNSSGLDEAWTLIDSGAVALPGDPTMNGDQRGVLGPLVNVDSGGVGYQHYKMVFPALKDLPRANSMQVAEIQLFSDEAGTTGILAPGNPVRAVNFGFESRYPLGERPAMALDQNAGTKYLNFGEERSGLIITNVEGPAQVVAMSLTTANDAPDRDPASYELWGTNDVISSLDGTDGLNDESWTLISMGPLSLSTDRGVTSTVAINATAAYESFKLVFPTVKNAAGTNSMQIADVQLHIPEPGSAALALVAMALGGAVRRRR